MIIIGDIHGCNKTLQALLAQIPQEEIDKGLVVSGDLVDRGARSKEVVEWAINNNIEVVSGNHEDMMVEDYADGKIRLHSDWMYNGGTATLKSYENPSKGFDHELLKKHVEWMKTLPTFLEFKNIKNSNGDYLVVSHSSACTAWHDRDILGSEKEIMWCRPSNITKIDGVFNVFGHTPVKEPKIEPHYANIDTGCAYVKQGYGKLTALQFPEMHTYQQENID